MTPTDALPALTALVFTAVLVLAPVAGAGVLELGVVDLLKLMGTLETPHASGIGASLTAVSRFFGFFASELTRSYLTQRPLR